MKSKLLVSSVVAAGLLAGAAVFTSTGQANSVKTYGQAANVAQSDPQAVTKKRRSIMKSLSKTRKALRKSAKKGMAGSAEAAQAAKIASLAKQFSRMFGSRATANDKVKGRAKPAIWEKSADFNKRMAKMQKAAAAGVKAAKAGDAKGVSKAMKGMGCGGCHKPYRGPKPK
jgi:cytochrome c556